MRSFSTLARISGRSVFGRAEVDRPAEQVLQVEFQAHEVVERGLALERDEDVHVAPLVVVAPGHRAEDGQGLHPVLLPEAGGLGVQAIEDGLSGRWSSAPCGGTVDRPFCQKIPTLHARTQAFSPRPRTRPHAPDPAVDARGSPRDRRPRGRRVRRADARAHGERGPGRGRGLAAKKPGTAGPTCSSCAGRVTTAATAAWSPGTWSSGGSPSRSPGSPTRPRSRGDAAAQWAILDRSGVDQAAVTGDTLPDRFGEWLDGAGWVVDGLLGTGPSGRWAGCSARRSRPSTPRGRRCWRSTSPPASTPTGASRRRGGPGDGHGDVRRPQGRVRRPGGRRVHGRGPSGRHRRPPPAPRCVPLSPAVAGRDRGGGGPSSARRATTRIAGASKTGANSQGWASTAGAVASRVASRVDSDRASGARSARYSIVSPWEFSLWPVERRDFAQGRAEPFGIPHRCGAIPWGGGAGESPRSRPPSITLRVSPPAVLGKRRGPPDWGRARRPRRAADLSAAGRRRPAPGW